MSSAPGKIDFLVSPWGVRAGLVTFISAGNGRNSFSLHRQTGERVVAILGSLRGGLRSTPWASCPLAWQLKGGGWFSIMNPKKGPDDQGSPEASEGG